MPDTLLHDINETRFHKFINDHLIGLSQSTTSNLYIVTNYLLKHSHLPIRINLMDTVDNDNEFWGKLHHLNQDYDYSDDPYGLVKDIVRYYYHQFPVPNDVKTLDKIWECFLWETSYRLYIKAQFARQGHSVNFYTDNLTPYLKISN